MKCFDLVKDEEVAPSLATDLAGNALDNPFTWYLNAEKNQLVLGQAPKNSRQEAWPECSVSPNVSTFLDCISPVETMGWPKDALNTLICPPDSIMTGARAWSFPWSPSNGGSTKGIVGLELICRHFSANGISYTDEATGPFFGSKSGNLSQRECGEGEVIEKIEGQVTQKRLFTLGLYCAPLDPIKDPAVVSCTDANAICQLQKSIGTGEIGYPYEDGFHFWIAVPYNDMAINGLGVYSASYGILSVDSIWGVGL